MIKGRKRGCLIIFLIVIIFFTSCTNTTGQSTEGKKGTQEEKNVTPVSGGTLSFSILKPAHFIPLLNQEEESYYMMKLIFEPLVSLDENNKVKGTLAENWTVQDNGNKILFHLRKNVLWHDGKAFHADDVKFTLDVLKNKDVDSPYKSYVENVSSYQVINDSTIELTFSKGKVGHLEDFIFPILPAHRYKKVKDVVTTYKLDPIGTGPYQLERYQENRYITLKANENYWGQVPHIKKILMKIRNNSQEIVKSFESKDTDLLKATDPDWSRFSEDKHLKIYSYPTQDYNFIALNYNNELFQDKNVRKAIQMAINRKKMIKDIYLGQGEIADMPISPTSWLYDKQQKPYSFQPEKAKKLLQKSGWKDSNNNQYMDKEFSKGKKELTFDLIVNKDNPIRLQEANSIQRYLKNIGIKVNISRLSIEQIQEKMLNKDFDGILTGWSLSFVPDLSFAFHSSEIKNGRNFISYKNPQMDRLLMNTAKTYGEKERKSQYSKLQDKIIQELPYINLYFNESAIIVNDRIKGPIQPTDYNIFNNIEEWYIKYK